MALILLGHPDFDKSFANKTIIEELQKSDLDIEVRHLLHLYPGYKIDVQAEQKALLRHNTIVFQYPFYWYNMPAILKLWFDVVFEYRFAFGPTGDKLKGKNFIASFTVGASESDYNVLGEHHFRVYEFCKHLEQTAYYAQMNYIDPFYFYKTSLAAGFTEQQIKEEAKVHAKKLVTRLAELEKILCHRYAKSISNEAT